jgi:hypothetical protein
MEGRLRGVKPVMDYLERATMRGTKTAVPIENIPGIMTDPGTLIGEGFGGILKLEWSYRWCCTWD